MEEPGIQDPRGLLMNWLGWFSLLGEIREIVISKWFIPSPVFLDEVRIDPFTCLASPSCTCIQITFKIPIFKTKNIWKNRKRKISWYISHILGDFYYRFRLIEVSSFYMLIKCYRFCGDNITAVNFDNSPDLITIHILVKLMRFIIRFIFARLNFPHPRKTYVYSDL